MKRLFLITVIILSLGCATTSDGLPASKVITDTKGLDMGKYNQDLNECRGFASQIDVTKETGKGFLIGTLIGGAFGAVTGNSDDAKRDAGTGALVGILTGADEALSEQDMVIKNCLIGRDYKVLN
tara:strand:- start:43 stop:417 length:375 start_codon:yes stop_codon:yes gene_type:complete